MKLRIPLGLWTSRISIAALLALSCASFPAQAQDASPGTLISLDADSTAINSVLQILASRSGLNIVTSPDTHGRKITIHLRNTPFEEALNLVVRAAGLGYERVGSSILVADVNGLATPTGLVTRIFDLKYADGRELRTMLEVLTKDVSASPAGNQLVVRASQAVVEQVADLIAHMDKKPEQVLLEARLIEVNTTDLLEAGINWEKITKWNTVITEGKPAATAQGQVPTALDFIKTNQTLDYYRQLAAFQVAVDALLTDGKARLLSNSRVVTVDGKPAEIFAGETVPVMISSLQSPGAGGGTMQTVQVEKIDVGVKLNITPRLSGDGYITTLVEPEISRILAFVGPNNDLPETSTRRAKTLVRVRDGQKIYLGGLLSEEKRRTVSRVPLLSSIPFVGYLFRHYRDETIRLDLVIEITPRIVGDEGASLPTPPPPDEGR